MLRSMVSPLLVIFLCVADVEPNPVKSKFFTRLVELKKVNEYVPAVKLKLIEFASDSAPTSTVVAVAVAFVMLTT